MLGSDRVEGNVMVGFVEEIRFVDIIVIDNAAGQFATMVLLVLIHLVLTMMVCLWVGVRVR